MPGGGLVIVCGVLLWRIVWWLSWGCLASRCLAYLVVAWMLPGGCLVRRHLRELPESCPSTQRVVRELFLEPAQGPSCLSFHGPCLSGWSLGGCCLASLGSPRRCLAVGNRIALETILVAWHTIAAAWQEILAAWQASLQSKAGSLASKPGSLASKSGSLACKVGCLAPTEPELGAKETDLRACPWGMGQGGACLLYTSDAADE